MPKVYINQEAHDAMRVQSVVDGGDMADTRDKDGLVELSHEVVLKLDHIIKHHPTVHSYSEAIIYLIHGGAGGESL